METDFSIPHEPAAAGNPKDILHVEIRESFAIKIMNELLSIAPKLQKCIFILIHLRVSILQSRENGHKVTSNVPLF